MDDVQQLRVKLGLPAAPLVTAGLATACSFFRKTLREDPARWWEYFRGIDFHRPVRLEFLPPGTRLAQHVSAGIAREKPFVYFTDPGTSPTITGTTFPEPQYRLFETVRPTLALVSTAGSISFNDVAGRRLDPVSRMGGGRQFILARRDAPDPIYVQG